MYFPPPDTPVKDELPLWLTSLTPPCSIASWIMYSFPTISHLIWPNLSAQVALSSLKQSPHLPWGPTPYSCSSYFTDTLSSLSSGSFLLKFYSWSAQLLPSDLFSSNVSVFSSYITEYAYNSKIYIASPPFCSEFQTHLPTAYFPALFICLIGIPT